MTTWNSGSAWNSGEQWGIEEPADPENLTVETQSEHEILLEWDIVGVADQTNIYRAEESGDSLEGYEQITSVDAPVEDYTDEDLTNGRTYHYRVATENAVGESGQSNEDNDTTDLPEPEIGGFGTDEEREITVEIDLQDDNGDGDITVYRDDAELETIEDLETEEYLDDDDIRDGREYEYHLYRDTGQNSAEGPADTTIAYLPDAEGLSLDGTEPEELETEWSSTLNNGEYRLEYRDDDPDGDHPDYEHETTVDYDGDLEHTIEDVLDGEQFSVRLRTQTEHAEGEWLTADEITKLRSADEIDFADVDATELELTWANNSIFDGSNKVYRRRLYSDHEGQWRLVGTAASDGESFVDDGATPDVEYEYYVRAQSQWISTDSDSSTTRTEDVGLSHRAVPPRGWYVSIDHPSGTPLIPAILSDGTLLEPTLNGQPQATIDIPRDEAYLAEDLEGADMHVYKNGDRRPIDELEDVVIETDRDELIGFGGTELEQDVQVDAADQPWHELAEDLLEEHTDLRLNIDAPEAAIDEGVTIEDADDELSHEQLFEMLADAETVPIDMVDGRPTVLQTCFWVDGSEFSGADSISDSEFSGGEGGEYDGGSANSDTIVSPEYTVPADEVGLYGRVGEYEESPEFEVYIGGLDAGDQFGEIPHEFDSTSMEWFNLTSFFSGDPVDLDPGDYEIELVQTQAAGGSFIFDEIVVFDERFHDVDDFDNEVHEPDGDLDRPYEYAAEPADLETEMLPQFRRAVAGRVDVETNDDEGLFELAISADNGLNWYDATDTDSLEVESDDPGPYIRVSVGMGHRRDLDAQDDTPRFGYEPQILESIEITADMDDTPLAVNYDDEGDLADVLALMAEQSEAVWEIWQDGDQTVFEWTWPGQRQSSRADAIADYSVTKHSRRTLRCKVKGSNAPVNGETVDVDELGETYELAEADVVRGKETVRGEDGDRLSVGLDYELHATDGEIEVLENGSVEEDDTLEIDYDYTVSGTYEHEDYDGDRREARTENIPACRSERAAEQAAKVIVDEASVPRWEADVTIAYEDVQDIRLSDTLDLEDVPGDAEVVREIEDDGSESGLSLQLGNRPKVSETVSQIQSQLSSASDLV